MLLNESYLTLLKKNRNLIPIISIEGGKESTDSRRGPGIYDRIMKSMDDLSKENLIFGCSVTVTTENLSDVTSEEFIGDEEREIFSSALSDLRKDHEEIVFVSFPGDEKSSGGCIAAGRGFFHINSHGGAEPCPFSPYSDINVRDTSLKEAISSPLFMALQNQNVLAGDHVGGCVLFEKKDQVEALMRR